MSETGKRRTTLVMADVKDVDGFMRRTVELDEHGAISIKGQDLGPRVGQFFGGFGEYEFVRQLTVKQTAKLRRLLRVTAEDDLLMVIEGRFKSAGELEDFVQKHRIPGKMWTWVGD